MDASAAQDLLEVLLVGAGLGDRRRRILKLVAVEDADDPVGRGDDPLLAEPLRSRHARGAGGLAAETSRADPGLGVHDLLVGHLADDPLAEVERPQALL